ncbi:MAG: hypothetical protein WCF65_04470 [Parachlamydiaceae bacterium]
MVQKDLDIQIQGSDPLELNRYYDGGHHFESEIGYGVGLSCPLLLSFDSSNALTYMLGMTPTTDNTDKVLKYERSLQKSIFQNLLMLKKLQGTF